MLGVRLDKETELRLENLCAETGHSKSYYAKKALTTFLDDREDYLLGIAELEKKESVISLKALGKELCLGETQKTPIEKLQAQQTSYFL